MSLKMKELEAQSGFGREAIRFYIREGILPQPTKPKKNVALYSDEHVVKLKLIRKFRDEHYLPLSEIKNRLNDADLSKLSANSDLAEFEIAYHALLDGNLPKQDLTIEAAAEQTGFTIEELQTLDRNGTIFLQEKAGKTYLSSEDMEILQNWATIRALGYKAEDGFGFDLLQRYADSVADLAETELGLFLNAYSDLPTEQSAEMGAKGVEAANDLLKQFHTRAINHALRKRVREKS